MRQSRYHASSFRHSSFISGKPFIPEQFTHHMRFHAWSLCPALVGASRHGSGMPPVFREPQEGHGCFEGSYHPEYRRWYSLQIKCRPICLHFHRTHTNRERCRCTPAHFFLHGSALCPNTDAPSPLLRNPCSLTPPPTRSRHQGMNPKIVIQAWVHPDQVLSLAVAVGPTKGPQLDLRPV